jgi:acetoin utilization deacetylase AcuC-like enzyme
MKKTGIVKDDIFLEHIKDSGHIESPGRLLHVYEMLEAPDMAGLYTLIKPRSASKEEISWNHDINYISSIEETQNTMWVQLDMDTIANNFSWKASCLAVGGGFSLIDAIMEKKIDNGFLLCRPPGHHALHGHAMGFCIFNNIALAAYYLKNQYNLKKIMIIDWDLHHGNGTQASFYDDKEVLYISMHQYPYYPGSGAAEQIGKNEGEYYTVNIPLGAYQKDMDYANIFNLLIKPVTRQFNPEFILVSAGFDIYFNDPLGGMKVTEKGFAYFTSVLTELAEELCAGRIAFFLEGGYNFEGLADGVKAVIMECIDKSILSHDELIAFSGKKELKNPVVSRIIDIHSDKWQFELG